MSDIVLSGGVRSNLLQLQQTSDLITSTQTQLATGKRVNSALDNPINFFTAQGLTVRANDLNSLLDSMSTGINTIQAANNGITSHHQAGAVGAIAGQPGAADDRYHRARHARHPVQYICSARSTSSPAIPASTASICSAATTSPSR